MNSTVQNRPHVVATVTRPEDLEFLGAGPSPTADFLEFRLDDLLPHRGAAAEAIAAAPLPSLLTVRRPDEGGAGSLGNEERLSIYGDFLGQAALVDTEIASLQAAPFEGFPGRVRDAGAELVASFHDFHGFPGVEFLREQAETAWEIGCDIVKFAVRIERMEDLFGLVALVEEVTANGRQISAMGMGEMGRLSRLVLAKAGSCLNYGYLGTPNAPGQWSAEELTHLLAEI